MQTVPPPLPARPSLAYNAPMPPDIRIAPAQPSDLPLLRERLPAGGPAKHEDRLARQARGEVVYLIAWQDARPIGHALLKWDGSADAHVADRLDGPCPDIEDLFVLAELRGRGIGTQLLAEAERRVLARGMRCAGLSVGEDSNEAARRLYARLGYRDAGFGPYVEQGEYVDAEGRLRHWQEMCVYLTKRLA